MSTKPSSRRDLEARIRTLETEMRYASLIIIAHHRLISKLVYDVNGASGFDYTLAGTAYSRVGVVSDPAVLQSVKGRSPDSFNWYSLKTIANIRITSDRMTSEIP